MLNNKLVKIGLIILLGVIILYLLNTYNNRQEAEVIVEKPQKEEENFYGEHAKYEHFEEKMPQGTEQPAKEQPAKEQPVNDVVPSEPEENAVFQSVDQQEPNKNEMPKDCYPKDQLAPEELLPGNENSKWAQVNPKGEGELGDQNFLTNWISRWC